MRKALHFSLVISSLFIMLGIASCKPDKEPDFDDVTTEETPKDSVFLAYEDSLNKYFGPLEQDLLKKYTENQKNLETELDFYNFYRRTQTLKQSLKRTLQAHIRQLQIEGVMKENMPDFSWFKKTAMGLDVADVEHHTTCDVFYNYDILKQYALRTEGTTDDEYTQLIRVCFEDGRYFPAWIKTYENNEDFGCTLLGEGKHYKAIEQYVKALKQSQASGGLFKKEIKKIRTLIMRNIIFTNEFCGSANKALEELELIVARIDLESTDKSLKSLLEARIKQFKEVEKYEHLQFNCETGDCNHEEAAIPEF